MTLARHEPCQLLNAILSQSLSRCWTQTIRLPYAENVPVASPLCSRNQEQNRQFAPIPGTFAVDEH